MNRASFAFTLLAATALLTSCVVPTEPGFPFTAQRFNPPARYRVWWQVTEACAGKVADFDAVRWFTVPSGSLVVGGTHYDGYTWLGRSPRVVIERTALAGAGELVRHEMLHVIAGTGSHPRGEFVEKCGGIVVCTGECLSEAGGYPPPGVMDSVVGPEALAISAYLRPTPVPLSSDSGWVAIVVEARNPLSVPVQVRLRQPDRVQFRYEATGGFWSSATFGTDTLVAFAAGQTRRLVFDTRSRVPGVLDVQLGPQLLTGGFSTASSPPVAFDVVP